MNSVLLLVGRLAGWLGVGACVVAVLLRLAGQYYVGRVSAGALLQGGAAALLIACFCLLQVVVASRKS